MAENFCILVGKVIHGKTFAIAILETYIDQKGHDLPLSKKP